MIIHAEEWYSIAFGDKHTCVEPDVLRGQKFAALPRITAQTLIFQHQVHGVVGHAVAADNYNFYEKSLTHDGDYLITNMSNIGVGVLTADCLSLLVADQAHCAVGAIHAGWRGVIGGIIPAVISHMATAFGTNATDLSVWFGPCAHCCCYEVQPGFMRQLPVWSHEYIVKRENGYYFDLPGAAQGALVSGGVDRCQMHSALSKCTICNEQFCSYRRNAGASARQMSIIWIH